MTAELVTIGDELLIGQVVNTNAAWLGDQFVKLGIPVRHSVTVGDDRDAILDSFSRAFSRSDVIVVTGGLGPTHDDITRDVACEFFNTDLIEDPGVLARVTAIFAKRGLSLTPSNRDQAMAPRSCVVLENDFGTAPGMRFERGDAIMFILPGVPREMMGLFARHIVPALSGRSGRHIVSRTLSTSGIPESLLFERIGPVPDVVSGAASLAFLPSLRGVRMRITVDASSDDAAREVVDRAENYIRDRAGRFIYGVGEETLESVVDRILRERHETLAVAESCTGGLVTDWITNVPGSSEYFLGGVVSYSNTVKSAMLNVPAELIARVGAVSEEVAKAMAVGAKQMMGASIGLSTTGIAGPDGGSVEKPVGLVWIGISGAAGTSAHRFIFGEGRAANKERFATMALDLLRRHLLNIADE